jgi:hypothetical protein
VLSDEFNSKLVCLSRAESQHRICTHLSPSCALSHQCLVYPQLSRSLAGTENAFAFRADARGCCTPSTCHSTTPPPTSTENLGSAGTRTGSLCMLFEENYLFSMHRGLPQITVHLEYSFSLVVKPVPRDCFAWLSISPALPCLCELAPENPFTSPDSSLLFVVSLLVFFNCLLVSFCPSFLISQNPLCRRHHAQPGLRHRKSTLLGWSKGLLWYTSPRGMVACSMKFSSPLNINEMSDKHCLARRSLGNRGSLFVRPRNNHFRRVDLRGM